MALGNKKSSGQTTNNEAAGKPQFEEETGSDTTVAEQPKEKKVEEPKEETPSAQAKVSASTAVATAGARAVATQDTTQAAKKFERELEEMRGAADFSFGTYRVFKASNGEIQESGGEEETLGKWAKVRLLAWDNHFEVSPGEKGASTKDFVAYSKDGKIIDQVIGSEMKEWVGRSVDEYLAYLKDEKEGEGFANAKVREFYDTACALLGSESGDGPIGTVVQISLAQSSLTAFNKYKQGLKDAARCAAMGLPGFSLPEDAFTFFYLREQAKKGDDTWTKLKICAELPAKAREGLIG